MFYSEPPYADLIFQDATQKIIILEGGNVKLLHNSFLEESKIVNKKSTN